MAKQKKLICFPFVNGSLQDWVSTDLSDSEREQVYNGQFVVTKAWNGDVIWKPNEEVELTLHYKNYSRGRSAATFLWEDDNGHFYPMFLTDLDDLIKQNVCGSTIHAIFTYVKRGANYGIRLVKKI